MPRSPLPRSGRFARAVVLAWRRLTDGGKPTLIACSGGADSTALALALATTSQRLVLAHILHDLRPPEHAERDRDAVRALAERLGLPFVEASVQVTAHPGNPEAVARRLRYQALVRLAAEHGLPFVATAHHADDQLESVVMALIRGAGPRGLRGVADSRSLARGVTLIRPMLAVTHQQAIAACRTAGITWAEDATNQDTTRLRAALRHGPLKELAALRPGAASRASRTARLMADADALVREAAESIFTDATQWPRATLRVQRPLILAHGLRAAAHRLLDGGSMDRLTARTLDPAIRAIRDMSTQPRTFQWAGRLRLEVRAQSVSLFLVEHPPEMKRARSQ